MGVNVLKKGLKKHVSRVSFDSILLIWGLYIRRWMILSRGQALAENRIRLKRNPTPKQRLRVSHTNRRVCFTDYYYHSLSLNCYSRSRSVFIIEIGFEFFSFSFFFFLNRRDFKAKRLERRCRGEGKLLVQRLFPILVIFEKKENCISIDFSFRMIGK